MKDGKFVQVGTPEEVVARPADDYVADFTRDVPRAHVLTVRTIMRSANGERDFAGDVDASEVVQDLLAKVAEENRPFRVVDDGRQVGVVDRTAVLAAMIEER
jgi:glycine betaine/proline transport system ATP-binding protein